MTTSCGFETEATPTLGKTESMMVGGDDVFVVGVEHTEQRRTVVEDAGERELSDRTTGDEVRPLGADFKDAVERPVV